MRPNKSGKCKHIWQYFVLLAGLVNEHSPSPTTSDTSQTLKKSERHGLFSVGITRWISWRIAWPAQAGWQLRALRSPEAEEHLCSKKPAQAGGAHPVLTDFPIITWRSPFKAGQVLKYGLFFFFFSFLGGRGGYWLDLFAWPFRDILRRLTRSTAHCHRRRERNVYVCAYCLSGVVIVTTRMAVRTYTPDAGDHGELFWSGFCWDDSHPYAHTEAKYTGIMPVLFFVKRVRLPRKYNRYDKHNIKKRKEVFGGSNSNSIVGLAFRQN